MLSTSVPEGHKPVFKTLVSIAIAAGLAWIWHVPSCLAAGQAGVPSSASTVTTSRPGLSGATSAHDDSATHGIFKKSTRLDRSARLLKDNLLDVGDDLKGIATYPVDHPKTSLYALLGVAGLVAIDKPTTRYWQDKIQPVFKGYNLKAPRFMRKVPISGSGGVNGLLMLGISGSYVAGVAFDDQKAQLAAILSVKAAAYSVLVSQLLLKSLTGRLRPDPNLSHPSGGYGTTTNPYDFGHFHHLQLAPGGYATSMPSFTFTLYFSVARVYQQVYHNYWVPYSLAALALTSDIRGHHHWVSDMVAGSLIGTMIGTVVTDNASSDVDPAQADNMVVPLVSRHMTGLAWIHRF